MDQPNEYERAIEDYAEAIREEHATKEARSLAEKAHTEAVHVRMSLWRKVSSFIAKGHIKLGIYRLHTSRTGYQDGILLDGKTEFPDLFDMYR